MNSLESVLLVAAGGVVGAVVRYVVQIWFLTLRGNRPGVIPLGTLCVNMAGSFLLGLMVGAKIGDHGMLLAGTGFMGALTTFSTLNVESINMWLVGHRKTFVGYVVVTYSLGILLAYTGIWIGVKFENM